MSPSRRGFVLGVPVDVVDLGGASEQILEAARRSEPLSVTALAVHGVMTGVQNVKYRALLNAFDLIAPDGQPVRIGLNLLCGARVSTPVRGTDLTRAVLRGAAVQGLPVYFYGSRPDVLAAMAERLRRTLPTLEIAGTAPSAFRAVERPELDKIVSRIRESGARIVFVGLGCPRQEMFTYAARDLIGVPTVAVGAAFDYLAGSLKEPPLIWQRLSLEWLWRLALEPRRLWRRYVILNPAYLSLLTLQYLRIWRPGAPTEAEILTRIPA